MAPNVDIWNRLCTSTLSVGSVPGFCLGTKNWGYEPSCVGQLIGKLVVDLIEPKPPRVLGCSPN